MSYNSGSQQFCDNCGASVNGRFCETCGSQVSYQSNIGVTSPMAAGYTPLPTRQRRYRGSSSRWNATSIAAGIIIWLLFGLVPFIIYAVLIWIIRSNQRNSGNYSGYNY